MDAWKVTHTANGTRMSCQERVIDLQYLQAELDGDMWAPRAAARLYRRLVWTCLQARHFP